MAGVTSCVDIVRLEHIVEADSKFKIKILDGFINYTSNWEGFVMQENLKFSMQIKSHENALQKCCFFISRKRQVMEYVHENWVIFPTLFSVFINRENEAISMIPLEGGEFLFKTKRIIIEKFFLH